MTVPEHPDDELVDLALGHVAAERRSALAEHLLVCPHCRAEHDALAGAVEAVVVAAPPVQPPLGFDTRTLALMGEGRGEPGGEAPAAEREGGARRLVVVAAAIVVLLGAAASGWWVGRDDRPTGDDDRVATLTTAPGGRDVGTATVTEVDGAPVLVVGLVEGQPGATYTCRMRFADGSTLDTDPWYAGPAAGWLVPLPSERGPLTGIELLPPGSDTPWSTADLG